MIDDAIAPRKGPRIPRASRLVRLAPFREIAARCDHRDETTLRSLSERDETTAPI